jgi:hypothetical protein
VVSKVTQIQARLLEIDPAGFQRLAEAYLSARGYDRINSFGLVLGADKTTRGTPDTLITLPNGKYVFAEHTTQQTGVHEKFLGDVGKCFDEEKTGIPVTQIDEIVLVHTSRMSPEEEHGLAAECRRHGVRLSVFGPGTLANDLYLKHPGLARDFLGVAVDTGQIVTLDEFVAAYDKSAIATPLDTAFRFRDDEVTAAEAALHAGDLVIFSGRPGVGKSRLALEACRRFTARWPEFTVRGIRYTGVDLFEDLRVHFAPGNDYLVFVDDANRVSGFEHVLRLLHDGPPSRRVKVVATVRDYALNRVREIAAPYGGGVVIELGPLTDEQITTLVGEEFGIGNPLYLERIARVAGGNPRLAVMAARLAIERNTLESIHDVSALYDSYFASIRRDLEDLSSGPLLKVAAAMALFRVVDRTNDEIMRLASETFGVTAEAFWGAVRRLHELEIVDLYEDEVVRVSDQVLATYLFYLAVFREKAVDVAILLDQLFPAYRHRIVDALNPVLDAFGGETIADRLRPAVAEMWSQREATGDEHDLLHIAEVFWFVDETRTLRLARDRILAMAPAAEPAPALLSGRVDTNVPSPSVLGVLRTLRYGDEGTARTAIELLVEYGRRRPADLAKVAHVLEDDFGFRHTSYTFGYAVERTVVDVLWELARAGEDEFASRLLIQIAARLLRTHFQTTASKGHRAIIITRFDLVPTPELFALRAAIWERLFALYAVPRLRRAVAAVLEQFARSGYEVAQPEILAEDARVVVPLLATAIDPAEYADGAAALELLDHLERHDVPVDPNVRAQLRGPAHALAEALFLNRNERRELGYEESIRLRAERFRALIAGKRGADVDALLAQCAEIGAGLSDDHRKWQLRTGVVHLLLALAEESPEEFAPAMERHLTAGNALRLNDAALAAKLIELCGAEEAFTLLGTPGYPERERFLFWYFEVLIPESIDQARLDALYDLYRIAPIEALPHMPDFLLRYGHVDPAVVPTVTSILLSRAAADRRVAFALSGLFNTHAEVGGRLGELFADEPSILVRAYLAAHGATEAVDHDAAGFSQILDLDPGFVRTYMQWAASERSPLERYEDHRDYDRLWRRSDYQAVLWDVVHAIRDAEREGFVWSSHLAAFFRTKAHSEADPVVAERQDALLGRLIEEQHADAEFIEWLFHVVARLPEERRRAHLFRLLDHNRDFALFQRLPLEPNHWSWSGSQVPLLRHRIDFLESLLPSLQGLSYLDHKLEVQRRIQRLAQDVERAKRVDFQEGTP